MWRICHEVTTLLTTLLQATLVIYQYYEIRQCASVKVHDLPGGPGLVAFTSDIIGG